MTLLKRKNRMLTLRVSDADYQVLQEASLRNGARSISEYARASLFRESEGADVTVSGELKTRIEECAVELDSLNHALRHLRSQIAAPPGSGD